jgi:hypothetical protein
MQVDSDKPGLTGTLMRELLVTRGLKEGAAEVIRKNSL